MRNLLAIIHDPLHTDGFPQPPAPAPSMPKPLLSIIVLLLAACGTGGRSPSGVPAVWPGEVQAARRWTVPFVVGGQVREVIVAAGGRVSAGQVMAVVDPAPYEAAIADAADALGAAEGRLAEIGNYMRTDDLRAFSPSVTADESMAALRFAVLDAEIGRAVAGTRARYAASAREATALRAPEAGRITRVAVRAGATVQSGDAALVMEDDSVLEIVAAVPCRTVSGLRPGRRAGVWLDGPGGGVLHGLVHRVGTHDSDGRCDVAVSVVERASLPLGARVGLTFP
jgi:multidrug resistance efflux pump